MKKLVIPVSFLFIVACGGEKETPESVAQQWCDLNKKVESAKDEVEKEKAKADCKQFEESMEEKYKNDEAFMEKVEDLTEACEGESEHKDYDGD